MTPGQLAYETWIRFFEPTILLTHDDWASLSESARHGWEAIALTVEKALLERMKNILVEVRDRTLSEIQEVRVIK